MLIRRQFQEGGDVDNPPQPTADPAKQRALAIAAQQQPNVAQDAGRVAGDTLGGIGQGITNAGKSAGDWYGQNQNWLTPLLKGVGAMASSNSRYLGSAVLQGLGAGAEAYGQQQQSQADLATKQATQGQIRAQTSETEAQAQASWIRNAGGMSGVMHTAAGDVAMIHVMSDKGMEYIPWVEFEKRRQGNENIRWASPEETAQWAKGGTQPSAPAPVVGPATYGAGKVTPGTAAPAIAPPAAGAPKGAADIGSVTPNAFAPKPAAPIAASANPQEAGAAATPATKKDPFISASGDSLKDAKNESLMMGNPIENKKGADYYDETVRGGAAANSMAPTLGNLASTVSKAEQHGGLMSMGSTGLQARIAGVTALQTIARGFGMKDEDMPGWMTSISENQLLNKYQAILGGMRTHSLDQNSYAAMQQIANALPHMGLSKEANAEITAQLLMANQQDRDRFKSIRDYGGAQGGPDMNRAYAKAQDAYQRDYDPGQYQDMTRDLAHVIKENPPLIDALQHHKYTPEVAAALFKKLGYNPATARVFF